ncbi:TetR/AcrR family transcriptional regulator [Haliscomenobacter sp.]|uniref:TetR/AcrR family transcriptional regulator n=1 Tax=Haliscomenobacter sp. TaxID=2717303 RepID=UPI003364EAFD
MPKVNSDSEEKIKAAAKKIFLQKGFDGATFKNISEEAKVNTALLNYYFGTKEKLFLEVFDESFFLFIRLIYQIMEQDIPLEVKIYSMVDKYTDLILENPMMPIFITSEIQRNPEKLIKHFGIFKQPTDTFLARQLASEAAKGTIREIDALQFEMALLGLILFPFMGRPIMNLRGVDTDLAFKAFVLERKKIIPEMMMAYLKTGTKQQ